MIIMPIFSKKSERFSIKNRKIETYPIKGTRPRGKTAKEDEKFRKELLKNEKSNIEIIDNKDYIYKNLLKGPYGCEKDLELRKQPLAERIHNTKRMTYPFPILYDYNNFGLDENLPDPLNMMGSNVNKMKSDFTDNPPGIFIGQNGPEYLDGSIGPGFLSYFIFQLNSNNEYGNHLCATNGDKEFDWSNINKVSYQCELEIGDLLPMHGNPMSLGKTSQTTEWSKAQSIANLKGGYVMNGPFESIMGVYKN